MYTYIELYMFRHILCISLYTIPAIAALTAVSGAHSYCSEAGSRVKG